jgi:hypothetical protein
LALALALALTFVITASYCTGKIAPDSEQLSRQADTI